MIIIAVPNLAAMRKWLLALDSRLVSPEIQQRWLEKEREDDYNKCTVAFAMHEVGVRYYKDGGEA